MRVSRHEVERLAEKRLREGTLAIAHFHFQPKPWTCTLDELRRCGVAFEGRDQVVEVTVVTLVTRGMAHWHVAGAVWVPKREARASTRCIGCG